MCLPTSGEFGGFLRRCRLFTFVIGGADKFFSLVFCHVPVDSVLSVKGALRLATSFRRLEFASRKDSEKQSSGRPRVVPFFFFSFLLGGGKFNFVGASCQVSINPTPRLCASLFPYFCPPVILVFRQRCFRCALLLFSENAAFLTRAVRDVAREAKETDGFCKSQQSDTLVRISFAFPERGASSKRKGGGGACTVTPPFTN